MIGEEAAGRVQPLLATEVSPANGVVLVRTPPASEHARTASDADVEKHGRVVSRKDNDPRFALATKQANLKAYQQWMNQGSMLVKAGWRADADRAFRIVEECIVVPTCPECDRGMHKGRSHVGGEVRRCGTPTRCSVAGVAGEGLWHCKSCGNSLCAECGDKEINDFDAEGTSDVEDRVVGPALWYVWRANLVVWLGFFILLVVGWFIVDVDAQGIANSPQQGMLVVGVSIFTCGSLFALYLEVRAGMYVLPSQAIAVGKNSLPFNLWLPLMAIVSLILHADIYTTAIFIARVTKSTTKYIHVDIDILTNHTRRHSFTVEVFGALHNPCNQINWQWKKAVEQGALNHIPFFRHVTFVELTLMAGFVFFLQLAYALCYSWPRSPDLNSHNINDDPPSTGMIERATDHPVRYNAVFKKSTGHGRALQALAESGRMIILNWQDDLYLELAEREWKSASVVQEMRRGNVRFLMFGLQSVLIPNLQVTYLGIQEGRDDDSKGADWLTFLSICLTVAGGIKYVFWELFTLVKHASFVTAALEADEKRARKLRDNEMAWDVKLLIRSARHRTYFNILFVIFFVLAYVYLAIKAYMAMVVCSQGVWNWHADFGDWRNLTLHMERGCVDLTRVNSTMSEQCYGPV